MKLFDANENKGKDAFSFSFFFFCHKKEVRSQLKPPIITDNQWHLTESEKHCW